MYAYQLDRQRTSKRILNFTLRTAKFVLDFSEVFDKRALKTVTTRGMFGTPFHSVVCHMPMMYRYISLRSVNSEASERTFGKLR
jgi:hypothetical protein